MICPYCKGLQHVVRSRYFVRSSCSSPLAGKEYTMYTLSYSQLLQTLSYYVVEGPISSLELSSFLLLPFARKPFPKGNGDTVILIPGFTETELHMCLLERTLKAHGYNACAWGYGMNAGNHEASLCLLMKRIRREYALTGKRIHLVGHSLGGMYALYLGHIMRKQVASVCTMGSPMCLNNAQVNPLVALAVKTVTGKSIAEHLEHPRLHIIRTPPPVPTTTIAAYSDNIVGASSCVFPAEHAQVPHLDTVVAYGTHCGHIMSLATFMAIFHHLAHVHDPQPYDPHHYFSPHIVSCLYPSKPSV